MKKRRFGLFLILLLMLLAIPAQAAKLNYTSGWVDVGATLRLKVTGTKKKVTWSSSNRKVATVSAKGLVKGRKAGKAVITAKVGKRKYKCNVTVRKKASVSGKASVTFKTYANGTYLTVGDKITIKTAISPSGASVKWTSSNPKVASVSGGVVTARGAGEAEIRCDVKTKNSFAWKSIFITVYND